MKCLGYFKHAVCELLEGGEVGFWFDVEGMFLCRVRRVKNSLNALR